MKTTKREPHAPSAALPELDEFLRPFHVHFSRSEGRQSLERYLTGLLTEHPNKNCDTLAQIIPGTNKQRLHNLLTDIAFDDDDLNDQRVHTLMQLPSEGDAVFDPARRNKAKVPVDVAFQTKPEIALALLDHARELGIRHAAVTASFGLRISD